MIKLGVYLSKEPYGGGAFQYNQSVLAALNALPVDEYKVTAIYEKDLWSTYLAQFTFAQQKVVLSTGWKYLPERILKKLCRLMHIELSSMHEFYASVSWFSRQIDRLHMDYLIMPAQEGLAAQIKTPCISVIHDLMHRYESFPEASAPKEYQARETLFHNICVFSKMIFVDSEIGREQVIESYGEQFADKLFVLPFSPPMYLFTQDSVGNEITLPDKFFFYPAQFWQHKNHKNLLAAIALLRDKGVRVRMIFVGSKKNGYDEVLQIIADKKLEQQVSVLGYVSDNIMRTLYKKARAMIMPTFFGPTNIPPLEGMAMGCPVAVSRKYAMPWQVGDAGLTFDPSSVEEIAGIMERLWEDDGLCAELSARGIKRAEYFSQEQFNRRFYQAIKSLEKDCARIR